MTQLADSFYFHQVKILIRKQDQDSANRAEHIKFLLKLNNQEDVEQDITYNQFLDNLGKDES